MATIRDYEKLLEGKTCKWCFRESSNKKVPDTVVYLSACNIVNYNHPGGFKIDGFSERQWLYVECPVCDYQWSLWKLGIHEIESQ